MSLPAPPAGESKIWYSANCHCGAIRYRVLLPPLVATAEPISVMNCNCSLCTRNGYLNVYPLRGDVRVQLGEEEVLPGSPALRKAKEEVLGYYMPRGAGEGNEHVFCKKCGSSVWVDVKVGQQQVLGGEPDQVVVNTRMINEIDVKDLKLRYANGKDWNPQYKV